MGKDNKQSPLEFGSDGVDAVIPLGNGMSLDTGGEIGFDIGGGITLEPDGDLRIFGISTGD